MIKDKRLIKLLQKLISINSENPPGRELECAQFIEHDMCSLGIDVKTISYAKDRPNIIATLKGTLPRSEAAKGAICITPHFDTVPIGQGWKYKPLGGEIRNGKLYGRGTTDDKGNTASCMEVMRSLVEDKVKLKHDVVMVATVDEETGSRYGIVPLLEKEAFKCRFALVMDSTEFDAVTVQKGLLHSRVQIFGKKAHGAYNWRGHSAIEDAAKVINKLKQLKFKFKKNPLLMRGVTMNVGVISGGDKVNMVSDLCEFALDTRYPPDLKGADVIKKIKATIQHVTKNFKFIIDDHQLPYMIDNDHPAVKLYLKCAKNMKCSAKLKGSEGATVISLFQHHNIPTFATGWGAHATAHTNDEYIYIKSLKKGTRLLQEYIKEYDKV